MNVNMYEIVLFLKHVRRVELFDIYVKYKIVRKFNLYMT